MKMLPTQPVLLRQNPQNRVSSELHRLGSFGRIGLFAGVLFYKKDQKGDGGSLIGLRIVWTSNAQRSIQGLKSLGFKEGRWDDIESARTNGASRFGTFLKWALAIYLVLGFDRGDLNLDEGLAMAFAAEVTLAPFELHDGDLFGSLPAENIADHFGPFDDRRADLRLFVPAAYRENAIEGDGGGIFGHIANIDSNHVAFGYFDLGSAVFNDRVHGWTSLNP